VLNFKCKVIKGVVMKTADMNKELDKRYKTANSVVEFSLSRTQPKVERRKSFFKAVALANEAYKQKQICQA